MNITNHLLDKAQLIESPHCDQRPDEGDISLLVIHNISLPPGEYGSNHVIDFFRGCLQENEHPFFRDIVHSKVSAHLFLQRTGEVIQFVPFHKRAFHAGLSCFEGRSRCNDFSIGIELEGTDDEAYTDFQYKKLIDVTRCLMKSYTKIVPERIVGHSDIAPGRKTDPGAFFDWSFYLKSLVY